MNLSIPKESINTHFKAREVHLRNADRKWEGYAHPSYQWCKWFAVRSEKAGNECSKPTSQNSLPGQSHVVGLKYWEKNPSWTELEKNPSWTDNRDKRKSTTDKSQNDLREPEYIRRWVP